jgi:fermentation-respiration switch protein FrsA (DUF1100 family)
MDAAAVLIRVAIGIVCLALLVRWLEPRMAFFPTPGVQETPGMLGIRFADVSIPTADGETLHAWWLEHTSPRAQVIFWHGNGGNLSLWLDVVADLHRHGLSVLAVDYRGYGNSTGRASERGLYKDAEASIRYFRERLYRPGAPVVYWGRSIGSPVAAHAATLQASDALVLESPMPDVRTILRGNPVMWALSFLGSYTFPTGRFLERYTGPLLVIHGDRDTIIPYAAGRRVFEQAPSSRKTFVTIPGADHNDLHIADPATYWREVDQFLAALPAR